MSARPGSGVGLLRVACSLSNRCPSCVIESKWRRSWYMKDLDFGEPKKIPQPYALEDVRRVAVLPGLRAPALPSSSSTASFRSLARIFNSRAQRRTHRHLSTHRTSVRVRSSMDVLSSHQRRTDRSGDCGWAVLDNPSPFGTLSRLPIRHGRRLIWEPAPRQNDMACPRHPRQDQLGSGGGGPSLWVHWSYCWRYVICLTPQPPSRAPRVSDLAVSPAMDCLDCPVGLNPGPL